MKKRVLLILPPNVTVIEPFYSASKKHAPLLLGFPLGLGYIASYLLQSGEYEVKILDANKDDLRIPQILGLIREFAPAYVGITMYTVNAKVTVQLAEQIQAAFKDIKVIAGGPHASDDYVNLLSKYPFFDYVVVGEGEVTFAELLAALETGVSSAVAAVKGVAYLDAGKKVTFTGARPLVDFIDAFPAPARELVDFGHYIRKENLLPYSIEIMGSRGCTHRCVFCSFQKKWRARSAQEITKEMKELVARYPQTRSFLFFDDNFSADKKRAVELCQAIIDQGLHTYMWSCLCRADQVDAEMIGWMKKAGCTKIMFGLETADPAIMKNLNKKLAPAQVKKVVEMVAKAGIDVLAFFIIGNPGETKHSVKTSYDFAKKLKCQSTVWGIMQIYPGTELSRLQPCDDYVSYVYEPEVQEPCGAISANIKALVNPELNREQMKALYRKVFRDIVLYKALSHPFFTLKKFLRAPAGAARFLSGLLR